MKKFNLNLVYYFIVIYEERSLTRAAERIGITQPSLSAHLKQLRQQYNDHLFVRKSNTLDPTPLAHELYKPLKAAFLTISETFNKGSSFSPIDCDQIFRIASMNIASVFILPMVMKNIQSSAPDSVIEVVNIKSDMGEEVRRKRIDLILDVTGMHEHLVSELIWEDELCVVSCIGNSQVRGELSAEDFMRLKHVMLTHDNHQLNQLNTFHSPYFQQRKVARKLNTVRDFADSIYDSDWLVTIPRSLIGTCFDEHKVRIHDVPFSYIKPSISLYWHQNRNADPMHQWLRECFFNTLITDVKVEKIAS